jgi:hypothetical protein
MKIMQSSKKRWRLGQCIECERVVAVCPKRKRCKGCIEKGGEVAVAEKEKWVVTPRGRRVASFHIVTVNGRSHYSCWIGAWPVPGMPRTERAALRAIEHEYDFLHPDKTVILAVYTGRR